MSRPVPEGRPPEDKAAAAVPPAGAREACERVAARPAEATPGIRRRRERSPKKPPADAIIQGVPGLPGVWGLAGLAGEAVGSGRCHPVFLRLLRALTGADGAKAILTLPF